MNNYQRWYINLLVKHPYIVLLSISVFSCTCLVLPFIVKTMKLPNFQDPQMGFSTRNTKISNRLTAWHNLQNEIRPSGYLVKNPKEYLRILHKINITRDPNEPLIKRKGGRRKSKKKQNKVEYDYKNETVYGKIITNEKNVTEAPEDKWKVLQNLSDFTPNLLHITYEKQFCGGPDEKYAHLVISTVNQTNLFTWEHLQSLCRLETILMTSRNIPSLCISNTQIDGQCCKPWSLPNYIAVMFKRHSCLGITEEDVDKALGILQECAKYFHQDRLNVACTTRDECDIPLKCLRRNAVYNILNYLTSASFIPPDALSNSEPILYETIIFLPIAASIASVPLYHEIEEMCKKFEGLLIVAMNFGIKTMIFDEYLLRDAWLMGLGTSFVVVSVWMYTSSFFLTAMTITAIVFAMGITYFLYEVVFEISFFPFMNMLTVVICIGIGADNAFIFCKIWHLKKNDQTNNNEIAKIMYGTFNHAFRSMFVTTLTTAVAFLGSYVSSVTAISCFSIFAGTAIITNFLLTISWFPACLVIWEQTWLSTPIFACHFVAISQIQCCFKSRWSISSMCCKSFSTIWNGKKEFLIKTVIKLRYLWIGSFTAMAVASIIIVFVSPGMQLPSTVEFQLFRSNHPFEKYDFVYRNKFHFNTRKAGYILDEYKMPLRFVWGILPVDNGDYLNPANLGSLELDLNFDMADPASQVWLRNFCSNIRFQPFYQPVFGVSLTSCFIETFITSMERKCSDEFSRYDHGICCNISDFPFSRAIFDACIVEEMAEIYTGPTNLIYPTTAGVLFSKEDEPTIKAVVVEFESNVTFSMSFEAIDKFYKSVSEWTELQLITAPPSMKNGFFVSDLGFYDLQRELGRGTKIAIVLSMILASGVLILSTLNPLLSSLAIITITGSILTTISGLVLSGWTLNILESVAISTAIGLSVDFSLHYCINYRLCPPNLTDNREDATRYALSCLMGPSFMAGLTTAAAGFFMIFSLILPYFQIGLFLVLIMTISWIYATFFLGSLLVTLGPIRNACQYTYRGLCRRLLCHVSDPIRHENNEPMASTSSTTDLDRVSFIKHDTPLPVKKKLSYKEPYVRYTPNAGLADQSPSSNVTIIMADVITTENY